MQPSFTAVDRAHGVGLPACRTNAGQAPTVLFVITWLTLGGAEIQTVRLAVGLRQRGWNVAVASMLPPDAFRETLTAAGVVTYELGMRRGVPDPRAILRLRKVIRALKPDIVHSHMFHANMLCRAARGLLGGAALVCTAHSLKETSEAGGATWHKDFLYRATDRLADVTTIICEAAAERFIRVRAVPVSRLRVVPNGIDTNEFQRSPELREKMRQALGLGEEFAWVAMGRMVPQKDYPNLLNAFASVQPQTAKLLIAGDGPLNDRLRQMTVDLGIQDRVMFLGVRSDVNAVLNAADAFVMSSEVEGLSLALLEAASCGLPIVATDAGGNRDVVKNGVNGFLVPASNSAALAAAMNRCARLDGHHRAALSEASRSLVVERYGIDGILDSWEELYIRTSRLSGRKPMNYSREAVA